MTRRAPPPGEVLMPQGARAAPTPRPSDEATAPQSEVGRVSRRGSNVTALRPPPNTPGPISAAPIQQFPEASVSPQHAPETAANWRGPQQAARPDDPLLDCLVVVTAILERPHSAEALTAGLPLVENRITPELFIRAAARAGLAARLVKRPLREIGDLSLPCVLLLKDARACVLTKLGGGRATVVLPETGHGMLEIAQEELARRYAGLALFVRPEYRFDARSDGARVQPTRDWFWGTLGRLRGIYVQVALAAVFVNLFALALPLFALNVFDRVLPAKGHETLWVLVLGIGVIFAFEFLLRLLRSRFIDAAGRSADVSMASTSLERVLGMRLESRPQSAGAFAHQLRELETLRDSFASATLVALVDLPFVLLFIGVVAIIGGPVALVPLVAVPLVVGAGWFLRRSLNTVVTRSAPESAQKHALLVETILGLEAIKGLGAEGRIQRDWERLAGMTAKSAERTHALSQFGQHFASLAGQSVSVGVLVVGAYLIFAGELTVGALVACTILSGRAMALLTRAAALFTRLEQSAASLETIDKIMTMPAERPAGRQFLHRPLLRGAIEFREVEFSYPDRPTPALEGVTFSIRAGERVGIIGKIGSGKTTIERLILGFYQPQKGTIRIDGTDIKQVDPADLRRNIGYVPQDLFLFVGSVRENIAMGAAHADDDAILRAARIAGVDGFVARHPQGFDLQVGERGEALSSGQRQSIAIARALVRDPNILILDEPTSAMDKGSEDWLVARLGEITGGKTLVLATQRLSLLTLVERVIVMDGGRIVADGPRDQVLERLAKGRIRGAE